MARGYYGAGVAERLQRSTHGDLYSGGDGAVDGGAEVWRTHATLAGVIVGFFIPLKEQDGKSPARQLE